jgi:hypothetical protein
MCVDLTVKKGRSWLSVKAKPQAASITAETTRLPAGSRVSSSSAWSRRFRRPLPARGPSCHHGHNLLLPTPPPGTIEFTFVCWASSVSNARPQRRTRVRGLGGRADAAAHAVMLLTPLLRPNGTAFLLAFRLADGVYRMRAVERCKRPASAVQRQVKFGLLCQIDRVNLDGCAGVP